MSLLSTCWKIKLFSFIYTHIQLIFLIGSQLLLVLLIRGPLSPFFVVFLLLLGIVENCVSGGDIFEDLLGLQR